MKQAFTLVEVIIIVVILGILVSFAMPAYRVTQERALDKEAKANLVLIQATENMYKIESNVFYGPSAVHADLNTNLSVSLPPADGEQKWNYSTNVTAAVGVNPATVCAQATRNGYDNRNWKIMDTDNAPSAGACP